MSLRMDKLWVLFKKDLKSILNNKNILLIMLLPIFFAVAYQTIFGDQRLSDMAATNFVLTLCVLLNISALPMSSLSLMVAEEKEKNTLRTLMLSDVSSTEFLFSKASVVLLAMIISNVAIYGITSAPMEYIAPYILVTTCISGSVLFFGAIIGLLAKDQMTTGSLSTPFMFIFMFLPMFSDTIPFLKAISKWVPTTSLMEIIDRVFKGVGLFDSSQFFSYFVVLLWWILGIVLFGVIFKRKGLDN